MIRENRKPYDPLNILLMPRWSPAVVSVQSIISIIDNVDYAIAVARDEEESRCIKNGWTAADDVPLLILRVSVETSCKWSVDAITHISSANGGRAICVFLADGYDVPGYDAEKRSHWNKQFAESLQRSVLDSQVHEYSNSWATSPPRAR